MTLKLSAVVTAAAIAAFALAAPSSASAKALPPLHGFCIDPTPGACVDNGVSTPSSENPPVFTFTSGGHSLSGDLIIGILIPNDISPPASFTILNNSSLATIGTATPLSTSTSWKTGELGAYMTRSEEH